MLRCPRKIKHAGAHTVPTIPVWTKPVLCTNWPKITMLFYYLKVPKDFSPLGPTLALTGALKWGTVWTCISIETEISNGWIRIYVFY